MEDDDATARGDEAAALASIYGESVRVMADGAVIEVIFKRERMRRAPLASVAFRPVGPHASIISPLQIDLPGAPLPTTLTLRAHLPTDYPSTSAPVVEAVLPGGGDTDAASTAVAAAVEAAWAEAAGMPILYTVAEALREREEAIAVARQVDEAAEDEPPAPADGEEDEAAERGGKEGRGGGSAPSADPPTTTTTTATTADETFTALAASLHITSYPPVVVKRSTFQAHTAPVANPAAARAVVDALLTNKRIAAATHNIMAYRIADPVTGALAADCDDDGEAAAGGRLAFMLAAAKVEGVVVVVSRWYGGVLLGPSRFSVINNTARDALVAGGYIKDSAGGRKGGR